MVERIRLLPGVLLRRLKFEPELAGIRLKGFYLHLIYRQTQAGRDLLFDILLNGSIDIIRSPDSPVYRSDIDNVGIQRMNGDGLDRTSIWSCPWRGGRP